MDKLTGGKFTFVSTTPVPQARIQLGYHDMNKQYPFVLTTYDCRENEGLAQALALKSDVVILGSAPEKYILARLKQKKLTFRYSERIHKQGLPLKKYPRAFAGAWLHHGRFLCKPLYMLCASAYTAADFAKFGIYLRRTFKWGYFPEVKRQEIDALIERKHKNSKIEILWVARFLKLKHPEAAIAVAERLKQANVDFNLKLIGSGEMEDTIRAMIREKKLEDCVHMLGAMSPEEVRDYMEKADIFLFNSDFNEGWGAVLNEAMNSACAVVASHAIGSAPFLIDDGKNGYMYKNGDIDDLYAKVVKLIEQPEHREKVGRAAYYTMIEQWNAEMAAERFITLAKALMDGKRADLYNDGPCSRAKILNNKWLR